MEALQGLSNGIAIRYKLDEKLFDVRHLRGGNASSSLIQSLIYADDCALVAHSPSDIQHMLDCFNKAAETYGLKISVQKTEVLYQSIYGSANPSIQLGDSDLRVLDSVTYLGSVIPTQHRLLCLGMLHSTGKSMYICRRLQSHLVI